MTLKRVAATGFASATLFATVAGPVSAQPVVTGGLVNITIVDVLSGNTIASYNDVNVALALQLAANVCDVNVAVLAVQIDTGTATCTNGDQEVTISQTA